MAVERYSLQNADERHQEFKQPHLTCGEGVLAEDLDGDPPPKAAHTVETLAGQNPESGLFVAAHGPRVGTGDVEPERLDSARETDVRNHLDEPGPKPPVAAGWIDAVAHVADGAALAIDVVK